ncbi:hypothetical protein NAS141_04353 [Sulfitobacter sp. NAS-14.1]|nr:hypothetical protein NAS141_04353 [Sulfitobacter sp. NAS-14.1]
MVGRDRKIGKFCDRVFNVGFFKKLVRISLFKVDRRIDLLDPFCKSCFGVEIDAMARAQADVVTIPLQFECGQATDGDGLMH